MHRNIAVTKPQPPLPPKLNLTGSLIDQSIMSIKFIREFAIYADSCLPYSSTLIVEGKDAYEEKQPFKSTKKKPNVIDINMLVTEETENLRRTKEKVSKENETSSGVPLNTKEGQIDPFTESEDEEENEKFIREVLLKVPLAIRLKYYEQKDKVESWEHETEIERKNYDETIEQHATSFLSVIQHCVTGGGAKDILNEALLCKNSVEKIQFFFHYLYIKKVLVDVALIPELQKRLTLPMKKEMNPQTFIHEMKEITRIIHTLGGGISLSQSQIIINLLTQLPSEYKGCIDQITTKRTRDGLTNANIDVQDKDIVGKLMKIYGNSFALKDPEKYLNYSSNDNKKEEKEDENLVAVYESLKGQVNPLVEKWMSMIMKERADKEEAKKKFKLERHSDAAADQPVDLDFIERITVTRFQELVKEKKITEMSYKVFSTYMTNGATTVNNDAKAKQGESKTTDPKDCKYCAMPKLICKAHQIKPQDCAFCTDPSKECRYHTAKKEKKSWWGKKKKKQKKEGENDSTDTTQLGSVSMIHGQFFNTNDISKKAKMAEEYWLGDNCSNSNVTNDPDILHNVLPIQGTIIGAGSAQITGIGIFIGKVTNRSKGKTNIAMKRVLVCPTLDRNIMSMDKMQLNENINIVTNTNDPKIEIKEGKDGKMTTRFDLHRRTDDNYLYIKAHKTEYEDLSPIQLDFLKSATEENRKEIKLFLIRCKESYKVEMEAKANEINSAAVYKHTSKPVYAKENFIPKPIAGIGEKKKLLKLSESLQKAVTLAGVDVHTKVSDIENDT